MLRPSIPIIASSKSNFPWRQELVKSALGIYNGGSYSVLICNRSSNLTFTMAGKKHRNLNSTSQEPSKKPCRQSPSMLNQGKRYNGRKVLDSPADKPLRPGPSTFFGSSTPDLVQQRRNQSSRSRPPRRRQRHSQLIGQRSHLNLPNDMREMPKAESKTFLSQSQEFRDFLLQKVFGDGKRKLDEWMSYCDNELSTAEEQRVEAEATMDWQPESTTVIPQTVDVRYPWDCKVEPGRVERRRRSEQDDVTEREVD